MDNETKLPTTPDWAAAPKWARHFAIDSDGKGYWFESYPRIEYSFWTSLGDYECAGLYNALNWKESRQKRPENA